MKEATKVDLDGYYVEPVLVPLSQTGVTEIRELLPAEDGEEPEEIVTGYIIAEKVPNGLFKPRWDFSNSEWAEGMPQEEIDLIRNAPQLIPTERRVDQLESENALLAIELIETQIKQEQSEIDQAMLIRELVDKGVI